ncbi:MAG: hypothetical protein L3J82_05730 [Planctomycetes bacterium]|nr:hypothetical protein [Planctomycetota bacterium]
MVDIPTFMNPLELDASAKAGNRKNSERAEINREEFYSLMIAGLQNQDPMEPISNSELLGQMSEMEQLSAATATADGIANLVDSLRFQQLTIASTFIGSVVQATDASGTEIQGLVGRVTTSGTETILGLQIPVTDSAGNVVRDSEGQPVSREVSVKLGDVQQVMSPALADFSSTIIDDAYDVPVPPVAGDDDDDEPESEEPTLEDSISTGEDDDSLVADDSTLTDQ